MENMESWDLVLLVVAGYVGTVTLVRLMVRRRDQILENLRKKLEKERRRKKAAKAKAQVESAGRAEAA